MSIGCHTPADRADMERQWPRLRAQFLIDRGGIVRSANIEGAKGLAEIGKPPSDEEILAAARTLSRWGARARPAPRNNAASGHR